MNARARNTLQNVKLLHAAGLGSRRKRRLPRQRWPALIETEYAKALIARMNLARSALATLLTSLPDLLEQARAARRVDSYEAPSSTITLIEYKLPWQYRVDALPFTPRWYYRYDADETRTLEEVMRAVRKRLEDALDPGSLKDLAAKFAERTQSAQRIALGSQVKAALGADVFTADKRIPAIRDHFINENVSLIKSIPGDLISEVEGIVNRAFTDATPHGVVAKQIEERFGVGESRARLIARDQIGKLYGQTNAYRQQDLGIESFIWRTSGDERVREEHAALEGEEFRYDDPPAEGLPGEPIQCRCSAEPVFRDMLKAPDEPNIEEPAQAETSTPVRSSFFPDVGPSDRAVIYAQQAHQQQMQRVQQHATVRQAEVEALAREREIATVAHERALQEAEMAHRAVAELEAQHAAERTALRIGEESHHPVGTIPAIEAVQQVPDVVPAVATIAPRYVPVPEVVLPPIDPTFGTRPETLLEKLQRTKPNYVHTPAERAPLTAEQQKLKEQAATTSELRARERAEQNRPVETPRGYSVESNEYGIKTYINEQTRERFTELEVNRGTVPVVQQAELPTAETRKPGVLKRLLRKLTGDDAHTDVSDDEELIVLLVANPQLAGALEELARYLS